MGARMRKQNMPNRRPNWEKERKIEKKREKERKIKKKRENAARVSVTFVQKKERENRILVQNMHYISDGDTLSGRISKFCFFYFRCIVTVCCFILLKWLIRSTIRHFQWQTYSIMFISIIRRIEMFHRLSISKLSKPPHFTRDQQNGKKERIDCEERKKNQYPIKNVEPFITCENMCAFHWCFFLLIFSS